MSYGFMVEAWGDMALFSRPELKVERVSYDCMTPSAARGILEAIMWKPAIKYVIDKIYVLNPIRFTNIRRNEVSTKSSARKVKQVMEGSEKPLHLATKDCIQQRASLVLRDVRYVIEAHFDMTEKAGTADNPGKFCEMIKRRAQKGQCYHQPYFGMRECPASFRLFEEDEVETAYPGDRRDLGLMLYDMDYSNPEDISPIFFRAVLDGGVLDLTNCEVYR